MSLSLTRPKSERLIRMNGAVEKKNVLKKLPGLRGKRSPGTMKARRAAFLESFSSTGRVTVQDRLKGTHYAINNHIFV